MITRWKGGSPLLALVVCGLSATPGEACPFCSAQGQTLTEEAAKADMVLFGGLLKGGPDRDTTDFRAQVIIKDHKLRRGRKVIEVKYSAPREKDGVRQQYLIFFSAHEKELGPYRQIPIEAGSKLPKYLQGALAVRSRPVGERLRFFFNSLECEDIDIANDAHKEFANADYNDFKRMARALPADRIVRWLKHPNTPAERLGLYSLMLGHCGQEKDAVVLKNLLEGPNDRPGSAEAGALAAYVMLRKKAGWARMKNVLADGKQNYSERHAALQAVRFLREYHSDLVSKKEVEEAMCLLLSQEDMADKAIEDMRKGQCWDRARAVLALRGTAVYKNRPLVRDAVLRYCLQCPNNPEAAAYVAEQRQADRERVDTTEDGLLNQG